MRNLTDTEILNWNDKLESSNYMLRPQYTSQSSYCDIVFVEKVRQRGNLGIDFVDTTDPTIKFKFIFSIASNRVDDFWKIFDKRKRIPLSNKTSGTLKNLEFTDKIIDSKDSTNHLVKEKEFTRFIYTFHGKLSQIIAYVTVLEDTIKFFEKIWGYDETGKEYCLVNYPIGSVCSMKKDKSSDFVVLDYEYSIVFGSHDIHYKVAKMIWNEKSPVVQYGEVILAVDNDLCFSRNNRIDNILEQ